MSIIGAMVETPSVKAPELSVGTGTMENLHGLQLTKESTVDAVGNILGGAAGVITGGGGGRWRSLTRIGEGVFNIVDIPISAGVDLTRPLLGPEPQYGKSDANFNVTRGINSFGHATKFRHYIGSTLTTAHALGTRAGSDIMRALGGRQNHTQN